MTVETFVKEHRAEIDAAIAKALRRAKNPRPTDHERRLWVLNDEPLYLWARSEGVQI